MTGDTRHTDTAHNKTETRYVPGYSRCTVLTDRTLSLTLQSHSYLFLVRLDVEPRESSVSSPPRVGRAREGPEHTGRREAPSLVLRCEAKGAGNDALAHRP